MRFATILICSLGLATSAHADKESTQLFEEGRALSQQGKYQEACDRFARSYEREQATGTQVNFADCEEHLGHLARAWQLFDSAAKQADREGNGVRAQYARRRATVLLPRLGAILVTVEAPDERMEILIGGRAYVSGPEVRAFVDPGEIEIRAQLPGKLFKKSVRVGAGESATVTIPPFGSNAATTPSTSTSTSTSSEKSRGWVISAGVLGGVGVVGLSTAAVLTIAASRGYGDAFADGECMHTSRGPECTPAGIDRVESARSVAQVATVVFAGSAIAVVAAVIVYRLAPRTTVEVAPVVTGDSAAVTFGGRF